MIKLMQDIDLKHYTLILPSVAVGNVGQLAVDLLIANLNLPKIGQIFNPSFIPVVGANAYDENLDEIITTIDIYANTEEHIVVIQIRSPYVENLTEFFNDVMQFVIKKQLSKVIILTSSYDYLMKEIQPEAFKLRYIASSHIYAQFGKRFNELNWIPYQSKIESDTIENERLQIPGGGFAKAIFNFLSNANIPCTILCKFCSEGNNIEDSQALLNYLNQWICVLKKADNKDWLYNYPPSWVNLDGKPPMQDIY